MNIIPYSKFKHGQRVTCEINGVKIDDAKISIDYTGDVYICQNVSEGAQADDLLGYRYSRFIIGRCNHDNTERIKITFPLRTLDDLEEGDVVVDKYGDERKVLGACGEVYFLSRWDNFKKAIGDCCTLEEIKQAGYTLKQEEEEPEEGKLELTAIRKDLPEKLYINGNIYILSK